ESRTDTTRELIQDMVQALVTGQCPDFDRQLLHHVHIWPRLESVLVNSTVYFRDIPQIQQA
ncbi:hypothetical protein BGW39_003885, partial [Mortierella sp. 14UC]